MPSGKRARQQRQQAAAAPPPVRAKGARPASPRTLWIVGGVILVVIIAVVLGISLSGSSANAATIGVPSETPTLGSSTKTNALGGPMPGAADVAKMLNGIPQKGLVLGDPNAPVQLTEFIDLQCPACQQFETTELETLLKDYVRTNKMSIKMQPWRILDRTSTEFDSLRGQKATIAASMQNKAFNFAQNLYNNQGVEDTGWLTNVAIANIASSVDGLDTRRLVSDANGPATANTIKTIDALGTAGQYSATPTILLAKLGQTPKVVSSGTPDLTTLKGQIDALLAKK
ncbi:MAG TPA: thioredoxin domain-containing protein [Gaiellaceae bacterium]|jgi:protein-disulfide isomerase